MRVIIQRVKRATLTAEVELVETGKKEMQLVSKINEGIVCLLGIHKEDTWKDALYIIKKCLYMKLWANDNNKKWEKCVTDLNYDVLLVSQFTLHANTKKGNKPDFHLAKDSDDALIMYNKMVEQMKTEYQSEKIKTGKFGHYMNIDMVSDGPVTVIVDTRENINNLNNQNKNEEKKT